MAYLVGLLVSLLVLLVVVHYVRPVLVLEYERGLRYRRGHFAAVLEPGVYWQVPLLLTVRKVDMRETYETIYGQEVLTSDGVPLKLTIAARYALRDPDVAINEVEDYKAALHTQLQLALRQVVSGAPIDDLLGKRQDLGKQVLDLASAKAAELGLRLIEASIKDLMIPGPLKNTFAEVIKARQEGLAALERARGETAALRNLANAAKMLENNPALLHLRTLQVLGAAGGNTIVLGMQPGMPVVPVGARNETGMPERRA